MSSQFLNSPAKNRITLDTFLGINKRERISSGEFADALNLTANKYPCLSTRAPRGIVRFKNEKSRIVSPMCPGKPSAALVDGDDIVIACENGSLLKGDKELKFFNGKEKQIISFNNRYVVAPLIASVKDDLSEVKLAQAYVSGKMTLSLLAELGGADIEYVSSDTAPTDGTKYWFSTKENGLYCWSDTDGKYISWPTTYIKFSNAELDFSDFSVGDTVSLMTGETAADASISSYTIAEANASYIVVSGICNPSESDEDEVYTLCREAPQLDYIVAHKNRVWGCYYGSVTTTEGEQFLNEIYASKLGDEKNWYSYQGISTDSYTSSVGEGGEFTGVGIVGDNVVFFKENCMYTIYGTQPSDYQIAKTDCFGIQNGSFRSAVTINGVLYYKSAHGIMRLESGSLPVCISTTLGVDRWNNAVAGTDGEKYFIQMTDTKGNTQLFVYDISAGVWHREELFDNKEILCFVNYKNNLCYITGTSTDIVSTTEYGLFYDLHPKTKPFRKNYDAYKDYISDLIEYLRYLTERYITEFLYSNYSLMSPENALKTVADKLGKEASEMTDEVLNEYLVSNRIMEPVGTAYYWSCDFVYLSSELGCNTDLPCHMMEYNIATDEYETVALIPELGAEQNFDWLAETGDFGMNYADFKRVSAIQIRLKLAEGSSVGVEISYDGEKFKHLKCFDKPMKSTVRIDMAPFVKCDNFRLRFKGTGQCVIYSLTIEYEDGGNKNVGF